MYNNKDCVCCAVLFRLGATYNAIYGGNLNDGNDVELCEGACIYNKDCVCYAVLLVLLCIIILFYYHNHAHDTVYDNYVYACMYMYVCIYVCMYACISCTSHEAHSA